MTPNDVNVAFVSFWRIHDRRVGQRKNKNFEVRWQWIVLLGSSALPRVTSTESEELAALRLLVEQQAQVLNEQAQTVSEQQQRLSVLEALVPNLQDKILDLEAQQGKSKKGSSFVFVNMLIHVFYKHNVF